MVLMSGPSSMDRAGWRGGNALDLHFGEVQFEFQSDTLYSEGFRYRQLWLLEHGLGKEIYFSPFF